MKCMYRISILKLIAELFITFMHKQSQRNEKPVIVERKNMLVRTREDKIKKEEEDAKKYNENKKSVVESGNMQRLKLRDYIHLHQLQKSKSKARSRSKSKRNENSQAFHQLLAPPAIPLERDLTDQTMKKPVNPTKEEQQLIKTQILRSFAFQKQKITEIQQFFTQKFQISNKQSNIVFMFKILENVRNINDCIQLMANHIKQIPRQQENNNENEVENQINTSFSFQNLHAETQKHKYDRKIQIKNQQNYSSSKSHLAFSFNPATHSTSSKIKNCQK